MDFTFHLKRLLSAVIFAKPLIYTLKKEKKKNKDRKKNKREDLHLYAVRYAWAFRVAKKEANSSLIGYILTEIDRLFFLYPCSNKDGITLLGKYQLGRIRNSSSIPNGTSSKCASFTTSIGRASAVAIKAIKPLTSLKPWLSL